jgi:cytochrome c biogenesis protein CcmG/thiol:disulfide interchange protein DsbE
VGALVFVPLLFLLGTRIGRDPSLVQSPLLGKPAPVFDLPRIDDTGTLSSDSLSGKIYVINFWASWCVPCREETPAVESFYRRWRHEGVEVVGVLFGDDADSARTFRQRFGGTWPLVNDPTGRAAIDYGVFGVPETYVVDSRGVVMAKLVGAVDAATLEDVIIGLDAGGGPVSSENERYRTTP